MFEYNEKQLWKISLSMPSLYGPNNDLKAISRHICFWRNINKNKISVTTDILLGVPKNLPAISMRNQDVIRKFLEKTFNIYSKEDLLFRLSEYSQGSMTNKAFNARRQTISFLPQKEISLLLNSLPEDSNEFFQYSIAVQYDKTLPPSGILAFDIANYISLCRLGATLGYLGKDEMLDYLYKPSILAQENYSGFYEFGIASTVGAIFCNGYTGFGKYFDSLNKAINHKNSYWKHLDWYTKLT